MKTAFAAAIALSLLSGTAAMAAPNDMHAGQNQYGQSQSDRGQGRGDHQGQPNQGQPNQGQTHQGQPNQGQVNNQPRGNGGQMNNQPTQQTNNQPSRPQGNQQPSQQGNTLSGNWSGGQNGAHNNGQANNQTRGNDNRNAPRQYSYNGRSYRAVAAPAWSAPRGYVNARRDWNRGERLPGAYRDRAYVIDYRAYGLMRPPYGYQWVRVSNNVYLVNAQNGFITQIVFSMFY